MERPDFSVITSGEEFNQWYWLKEEMFQICKESGLPTSGSKFELRDRIMFALDHDGAILSVPKKKKPTSSFDWANERLTLHTFITDNVSFGPNFRKFMASQLDQKFSCHSDFMHWVKMNVGKTLEDAVTEWKRLEDRKKDPAFKRKIADHNMMSQYVRDFLADNKGKTTKEAVHFWKAKRKMPTDDGFIRYHRSDLDLT
ncbi:MAG: DUF6434 domain-containing protein [Bacteroidota bacterium]